MNLRFRSLSALSLFALLALSPFSALAQDEPVPTETKLVAPKWDSLKKAYDYDSKTVPDIKSVAMENPLAYARHLEFKGEDGEKVTGIFIRPTKEGVYPVIVMLHGWTSKKEDMALFVGPALLEKGFAFLSLDAPMHGERKPEKAPAFDPGLWAKIHRNGIKDYRSAMGWLLKRKDVDPNRVGLLGYSMGAMMGSILGAVDDRIKCSALCVGGDIVVPNQEKLPIALRASSFEVAPSAYIGHIAPRPVLLLNGKQDATVTKLASDLLFSAAKMPKEQKLYESGHMLPKEAIQDAAQWLSDKLKKSE